MDNTKLTISDINSIKTWNNINQNNDQNDVVTNKLNITFNCISSINDKVAIWNGSILHIRCQGIVFPINDLLDSKIAVNTASISKVGGPKYVEDFINIVLGCKTGEIRVTEGHDLACRYVLHTVCPRYNPKYESAAINALYNCYRNALMASMEKGIRVIAFSPLHISRHNFPNELAIHLTTRTIRRFLEKYSEHIDLVILQVSDDLYDIYENIMPIYFPRNHSEEILSSENVPTDIGNEDGQPMQPNREIRISAFPYGPKTRSSESDEDSDSSNHSKRHSFTDITSSARHSLSQTQMAPALLRQTVLFKGEGGMASSMKVYEQGIILERKFDRLLRTSKKMDVTQLTEKRVFYQCGKDIQDRPLLLVIERNIPLDIETRKGEALAFIIWTLERVVKNKQFIIIYAHTQSHFQPSRNFLTEAVDLLNFRYYRNLLYLCMIHPTLFNRGYNWIFSTFNAPELKEKMITVTNLRQLYRIVNPSTLELPDFMYDYDRQVGGNNAYNDSVFINNQRSLQRKSNPLNSSNVDAQL